MKLKNHYAWLFAIWIVATICDSLACLVNFVDGKIVLGFVFLVLSVAFSFVSGMLLNKSIAVYKHNKICDWMHSVAEDLYEEEMENIKPFDEFENNNIVKCQDCKLFYSCHFSHLGGCTNGVEWEKKNG